MSKTVAIILNGDNIPYAFTEDYLVFVDKGYSRSSVKPDLLLGDFDSYDMLDYEVDDGVEVMRFPSEKDETDGELAVREVIGRGYKNLHIYGALGGRQDHVLGNLTLLAIAASLGANAVAISDSTTIYFVDKEFSSDMGEGTTVSVLPFLGDAHIMYAEGLKYPLRDEKLLQLSTRGISNVALGGAVKISVSEGGVFIFVREGR